MDSYAKRVKSNFYADSFFIQGNSAKDKNVVLVKAQNLLSTASEIPLKKFWMRHRPTTFSNVLLPHKMLWLFYVVLDDYIQMFPVIT